MKKEEIKKLLKKEVPWDERFFTLEKIIKSHEKY